MLHSQFPPFTGPCGDTHPEDSWTGRYVDISSSFCYEEMADIFGVTSAVELEDVVAMSGDEDGEPALACQGWALRV